jgi:hypothetical protein
MHCIHCGGHMAGQAKFCPYCGKAVAVQPEAGAPNRDNQATAVPGPKRPAKTRRRLTGCALALLLIVFLCGGVAGGLYFWLGLHRTNQIARIVPADTTAFISISPSIWQLPQLRHAGHLPAGATLLAAVPGLWEAGVALQTLPLHITIDPAREVLPWIGGEVSLAVLEYQPGIGGGRDDVYFGPPLILAAVTRDRAASDAFLAKIRRHLEREEVLFREELYRDILVAEITSPTAVPLAYATFNNLVVMATDGVVLRRAIDAAYGGEPVLNDQQTFRRALSDLPRNRLGYIYLDGADLRQQIPLETELWQAIDSLAIAIALDNTGVRFDYAARYDNSALLPAQREFLQQTANPLLLAGKTPSNSLVYLSSANLPLFWESIETRAWQQEVRLVRQESGIRLEQDLFALAADEYALIVVPDNDAWWFDEELRMGLALLAPVHNGRDAERALDEISHRLVQGYGLQRRQEEIDRQRATLLGYGDDLYGYTLIQETMLIGSSPETIRQVTRASRSALSQNQGFALATQSFPRRANLILYADVQALTRNIYAALPDNEQDFFDQEIRPYIQDIRAIALAATPMDRQGVVHGVLILVSK